jgi:hypothetical protein
LPDETPCGITDGRVANLIELPLVVRMTALAYLRDSDTSLGGQPQQLATEGR